MAERRLNCPVCKTTVLTNGLIDNELVAHPCPQCQGQWDRPQGLLEVARNAQRDQRPNRHPSKTHPASRLNQTETPKFCPDCGRFMRRHKVGHGIAFVVDRCGTCGGFWLDATRGLGDPPGPPHPRTPPLHRLRRLAGPKSPARSARRCHGERSSVTRSAPKTCRRSRRIKAWIEAPPPQGRTLRRPPRQKGPHLTKREPSGVRCCRREHRPPKNHRAQANPHPPHSLIAIPLPH